MESIVLNLIENNDLKDFDFQELEKEISNYPLEYRTKLNLPNFLTFGIEIEYEVLIKNMLIDM